MATGLAWLCHRRPWLAAVPLVLLAGCGDAPEPVVEQPRPIRTFTVADTVGGMVRKFTGVIEASTTTALSFPIGGTVEEVLVAVGDEVKRGDALARLDAEPVELDVQAADADLQRALADETAKEADLDRQQQLFDKDWVAAAAVEKAQAAYDSAVSQVNYARSRLALARRNLDNTAILAPFDGVVAERLVDPFQDVAGGQKLFSLNATGTLHAAFSIPESGIGDISIGQPASIEITSIGTIVEARITEVASSATSGNAFAAKASLLDPSDKIRPGMTALVSVAGGGPIGDVGYFIPLSAVAPGDAEMNGNVFKYDPEASVVRKTPIVGGGVRDNFVIVQDGLEPGDIIASAGVSFLVDGQSVSLLAE